MSFLLDNVSIIVGVFYKYATHKEGCSSLTRRELKKLIKKEFADVIEDPQDPKAVALTFQLLDINSDSLVDFDEYLLLIFRVAEACLSPLDSRGRVRQEEDTSRGELQGDKRTCHQQGYYESEGKEVCESRDFGWTHQIQGDWRKRQYYKAEPLEGDGERKRDYREVEREEYPSRDRRAIHTKKERDGSFPTESRLTVRYRSRQKTYETETRESGRRTQQAHDSDDEDGERCRISDAKWRGSECRRTQKSESKDGGRSRRWYCEDDKDLHKPDREQRRARQRDSDNREHDQRTAQQWGYGSQDEQQRRTQRWDFEARDGDHRWTQKRDGGLQDKEQWDQQESHSRDGDQKRTQQRGLREGREDRRFSQCVSDPRNSEKRRTCQPDIGKSGEERRSSRSVPDPTGYEQQKSIQEREPVTSGCRQRRCETVFGEGDQCRETSCASETREHVQVGRCEPGSQVTDSIHAQSPKPGLQEEDMSRDRRCELDPRKGDPRIPQSSEDEAADGGPQQQESAESQQRQTAIERPQTHEPEHPEGEKDQTCLHAAGPEQIVRGSQCGTELRGDQKRQPQPQEREQRRQPKEASKPQGTERLRNRTRSRQKNQEPKLQEAPKTQQPTTPEQSTTLEPRQLPVWSASCEGGGGTPTPTEVANTSSLQVREPQPPLDNESQAGPETPQNVGRPQTSEHAGSQEKSENKVNVVSNPLYEYIQAQKKSEEP